MLLDANKYLPDNLAENDVMLEVTDLINVLMTKQAGTFTEIVNSYHDSLEKVRDFKLVSYGAKLEIIKELGFAYITDILTLSETQLTQLLIFFNLIYVLKGKEEGLRLILDTLNLTYTYNVWDKTVPKGKPFTAKLTFTMVGSENVTLLSNLTKFVRAYMLPLVTVTTEITAPASGVYLSCGYNGIARIRSRKPFTAVAGVVQTLGTINELTLGQVEKLLVFDIFSTS